MQTMEREAAAQLNDLGEFDQDEFSAARQSIKKVFIESFGNPTARTFVLRVLAHFLLFILEIVSNKAMP